MRLSKMIELFNRSKVELAIQDGDCAGQSIPHLHVHILPKNAESSEIGQAENDILKTRTVDDMWQECLRYREFFDKNKDLL